MSQYIIPALGTIVVAIIEAIASRERKDMRAANERAEERAKLRTKESRLSMNMMSATLKLSVVTANALTGGHNNGNVQEARDAAEQANEEYEAFLRDITAKEISK